MTRRTSRRPVLLLAGVLAIVVALPLLPAGASAQEADPTASPAAEPTAAPTAEPTEPAPTPVEAATPTVSLRLAVSTAQVLPGEPVTLTVTAVDGEGRPVPDDAVDVLSRQGGTTTTAVAGRLTTGSDGTALLVWRPRVSAEYTLRRSNGPTADSERRIVHVQPTLTAAMSRPSVQVGSASVLGGTLAPAYAGVRLQVQRRFPDGSWRGVAVIGTNGTGAYAWPVAPRIVGRYVFRTVLPATYAYRGVHTPAVGLTVVADPTLRQGDRGPAVHALEQRLLAQKVDVGAVDGVFDSDLRHGVVAFQKTQGLRRTGLYDAATRSRLAHPVPVRLRHPAAGRAVEVDLAKQVLYLSDGGRLTRVVDVSTGNNQPYTVDGVRYTAFTPTGRFRITRKIDGIRISRLGELYRPAYFHQGWAIHGSPSVPPYPASHGCIRVTNSAQNRLFGLLTVGTPITVYR